MFKGRPARAGRRNVILAIMPASAVVETCASPVGAGCLWFRPQPGFLARPQSVPLAVRSPAGARGCCGTRRPKSPNLRCITSQTACLARAQTGRDDRVHARSPRLPSSLSVMLEWWRGRTEQPSLRQRLSGSVSRHERKRLSATRQDNRLRARPAASLSCSPAGRRLSSTDVMRCSARRGPADCSPGTASPPPLDVAAFAELHRVSVMVEDIPRSPNSASTRSSSGSTAPLPPTSASASPGKPAGDVGLGRTGRRTLASRCARRRDEQ